MTLLNVFSPGVRPHASDVRGDRSVALILLLLLALVLAPVIGLHVVLARLTLLQHSLSRSSPRMKPRRRQSPLAVDQARPGP